MVRAQKVVEAHVGFLKEQEARLTEAAGLFQSAGPFGDNSLEETRQAGVNYLDTLAKLLRLLTDDLQRGAPWNAETRSALTEQQKELATASQRWRRAQ
jgi:hypothetical protein